MGDMSLVRPFKIKVNQKTVGVGAERNVVRILFGLLRPQLRHGIQKHQMLAGATVEGVMKFVQAR